MKTYFLGAIVTASAIFTSLAPAALAQTWGVPAPNGSGDFSTALVFGNRGNSTLTRRWLVVDPDPTYLNCRQIPNGRVVARLAPGTIITAVATNRSNDAIVRHQGSPWLQVNTAGIQATNLTTCYVRANLRYIAPISEDN